MTTIAWDGKTLAVDRASWQGHLCSDAQKLYRIDRLQAWYAAAGDEALVQRVIRWLRTGTSESIPEKEQEHSFGLLVNERGEVFRVSGYLELAKIEKAPVSDGAGAPIAIGAMLAGADAIQAIAIAERCSDVARDCNFIRIMK